MAGAAFRIAQRRKQRALPGEAPEVSGDKAPPKVTGP